MEMFGQSGDSPSFTNTRNWVILTKKKPSHKMTCACGRKANVPSSSQTHTMQNFIANTST